MMDKAEFFYEENIEWFKKHYANSYDLRKRLKIAGDLLEKPSPGQLALDLGCGLGVFSQWLTKDLKLKTVSLDVGPQLLKSTQMISSSSCVIGDALELPFHNNSFDWVICSEVLERTRTPFKVLQEVHRILKLGGSLILTTPNRRWILCIQLMNILRLRNRQGLDNWIDYNGLKKRLLSIGFEMDRHFGFNSFPSTPLWTYPLIDWIDKGGSRWGAFYTNIALRAKKPDQAHHPNFKKES